MDKENQVLDYETIEYDEDVVRYEIEDYYDDLAEGASFEYSYDF